MLLELFPKDGWPDPYFSLYHDDVMAWESFPDCWAPFQYPIRRLIVKSWSREISSLNYCIALKFGPAAELPVKFQSDRSRLRDLRALALRRIVGYWNGPWSFVKGIHDADVTSLRCETDLWFVAWVRNWQTLPRQLTIYPTKYARFFCFVLMWLYHH